MNISDEAVEAVGRELYEDYDENFIATWDDVDEDKRSKWKDEARRYLEIAAEHNGAATATDRLYSAGKFDS